MAKKSKRAPSWLPGLKKAFRLDAQPLKVEQEVTSILKNGKLVEQVTIWIRGARTTPVQPRMIFVRGENRRPRPRRKK